MPLPVERPLVGERIRPAANAAVEHEGADVLHHPAFLVVGLLEEKAVVLNRTRLRVAPSRGRLLSAQG